MNKIILLLIIATSLAYSCKQSSEPKTEAHKAVSNQGVNIAYTDTSKGDTVLLFVHGWCLNKEYWSDQEKAFRDHYRIVAIDLPGFGQSGKNRTDWSTEKFAKDVDSVLVQLDLKQVILVGHSMAGEIVVEAATHEPDRVIGIVGIDNFKTVGTPESEESKKQYAQGMEMLKQNFKAVATQYMNETLFYKTTDSTIRKRILNDVARSDSTIAVASLAPSDVDDLMLLQNVKKKLYLINSDYTPTDTTSLVAHHIPYRLLIVHDTGHFPMVEKPQEFNARLSEVLKDVKNQKAN